MRAIGLAIAAASLGVAFAAAPVAAQRGPRKDVPTGAEIAQKARGAKLDDGRKLVAEFQGQPIAYTPAAGNASLGSLDELRAGHFLGVLDTKAAGDETGLPPGTYNIFVAEVDGTWRAFAEANGQVVKEAARVRVAPAEKGARTPRFGAKGWYIADPVCCIDYVGSPVVASVQVSPSPVSLKLGESVTLTATPLDAKGNPLTDKVVTWSVPSQSYFQIKLSPSGATARVLATGVGSPSATATSGGVSRSVPMTVSNICVCSIALANMNYGTLGVGAKVQFSLWVTAPDGSRLPLARNIGVGATPSVLRQDSVRVTDDYYVISYTAVGVGQAQVVATLADKTAQTQVTITGPATRVDVRPSIATVQVGQTLQATATTYDAGGTQLPSAPITWASNNPGIFMVSGTGLITGVSPGTSYLTATSGSIVGTAAVTVQPVPVASVTLTPSSTQMGTNATLTLTATLRDAAGNVLTGRTVQWTSTSLSIAAVDQSGLVTSGPSIGNATITATSEGKSGTASISVTAPSTPPNTTGVAVEVYW